MIWTMLAMAIMMSMLGSQSRYQWRRRPTLARAMLVVAVAAMGIYIAALPLWFGRH